MAQVPIFFKGEVMLLRWADNSSAGRTVTFLLDGEADNHPFRDLKSGNAHGQRIALVAVLIGDDEQPAPAAGAQRSVENGPDRSDSPHCETPEAGPKEQDKVRRRLKEMPLSNQCALMCSDPRFIEWLDCETEGEAEHVIKEKLRIDTRRKLDDPNFTFARHTWQAIHTSYELGEAYLP